jgi:hypothetical protein
MAPPDRTRADDDNERKQLLEERQKLQEERKSLERERKELEVQRRKLQDTSSGEQVHMDKLMTTLRKFGKNKSDLKSNKIALETRNATPGSDGSSSEFAPDKLPDLSCSDLELEEEEKKAEQNDNEEELKELKRIEEKKRKETLEKARQKLQDERKARQEKIRERIAAEEAEAKAKRKQEDTTKSDKFNLEYNSDRARCQRAFGWYSKLAQPKREVFKKKILLISTIDITDEDVDLLPWNASGTMVNVAKLNAALYSRRKT